MKVMKVIANILTYRLTVTVLAWIFQIIVFWPLFIVGIWIEALTFPYSEALYNAFLLSSFHSIVLYIASVVFYPFIKKYNEINDAWEGK